MKVDDISSPLSHTALIKAYLEGTWGNLVLTSPEEGERGETEERDKEQEQGHGIEHKKEKTKEKEQEKGKEHNPVGEEQDVTSSVDAKGLRQIKSCGILLFANFREEGQLVRKFLLMKHADRYDLPKGHVELGETELQCARREFWEETGIDADRVSIDPDFLYTDTYYPTYRRFGGEKVAKTLCMFLGEIKQDEGVDEKDKAIDMTVRPTEHAGYEWIEWKPPHSIQKTAIDPLLASIHIYLQNQQMGTSQTASTVGNANDK